MDKIFNQLLWVIMAGNKNDESQKKKSLVRLSRNFPLLYIEETIRCHLLINILVVIKKYRGRKDEIWGIPWMNYDNVRNNTKRLSIRHLPSSGMRRMRGFAPVRHM